MARAAAITESSSRAQPPRNRSMNMPSSAAPHPRQPDDRRERQTGARSRQDRGAPVGGTELFPRRWIARGLLFEERHAKNLRRPRRLRYFATSSGGGANAAWWARLSRSSSAARVPFNSSRERTYQAIA